MDKCSDLPLHSIYLSSKSHQAEALLRLHLGEDRSPRGTILPGPPHGEPCEQHPTTTTDFTLQKSPSTVCTLSWGAQPGFSPLSLESLLSGLECRDSPSLVYPSGRHSSQGTGRAVSAPLVWRPASSTPAPWNTFLGL